eukprot:3787596-Pyramimonas_sp.AAC.1
MIGTWPGQNNRPGSARGQCSIHLSFSTRHANNSCQRATINHTCVLDVSWTPKSTTLRFYRGSGLIMSRCSAPPRLMICAGA